MPRQLLRRQLSYGSHRGGWIKQSRHLQQTIPLVGIHVRALSALEVCLTVRKHFFTGWMQKSSENTTPLPSPSRADTALIIINFLKASIQWSQQTPGSPEYDWNLEAKGSFLHLCVTGALRPQTDTALGQVCTESVRVLFLMVVSVAMGTTWAQREGRGGIMYYHFTGI